MNPVAFVVLAVVLCVASVAALVVGDGNPGVAVAPAFAVALLYAVWRLRLRWPVLVLAFLALTLENPADVPAEGLWKSPIYTLGALLLTHLNVTLHSRSLFFSGLDLALVFLGIVVVSRKVTGSPIDRVGRVAGARPLQLFAGLALAGAAWMWIYGFAMGGADVASSLWQVQRVAYLPIVFFLFHEALRGRRDYAALAKLLIGAACVKACLALYIGFAVHAPAGMPPMQYATTHVDSMLFADAFCVVVLLLLDKRFGHRALLGLLVLPLLVGGMVINNRRLVWVEVAAGLMLVFVLAPSTRRKRAIVRGSIFAAPLLAVYSLIGWSSGSLLFRPVQVVRSMVDSSTDGSTAWRDWENYDLFCTIKAHPLTGLGYGHGYIEVVKLPDISEMYALYRFIPHNGILGLFAYGGVIGFTALSTVFVVGIFFAARAQRHATRADDRVAALSALMIIVIYLVHCYGDMGLGTWAGVFTVAPALAVAAKLAVSTGAWRNEVTSDVPVVSVLGEIA